MSTNQAARDLGQDYALKSDEEDQLKTLRNEFIIPTKRELKSKTLTLPWSNNASSDEVCIYFCGNSLGLQPRRTPERITSHLVAWAKKGVLGHFSAHADSNLPPFVHADDAAAKLMAPLLGARTEDVAVMETLTANLHLMMASFYLPTKEKYKIVIEGKAFPSDHYAVESQIRHHGFNPKEAMILIDPEKPEEVTISTAYIVSIIEKHASSTALILLPGVQYYTGQYLDIEHITAKAHEYGITIGWDLAHAVGNVILELDKWNVDFAVWCNYKYVNSGPGAIGGLFVHPRYSHVNTLAGNDEEGEFRPRLSGWWGGDRSIRFQMGKGKFDLRLRQPIVLADRIYPDFVPIPGAAGFQVGNPSALAITAVIASLEIFALTSMTNLRAKSMALTSYLEELLFRPPLPHDLDEQDMPYRIITPLDPKQRGAQLSVRLKPGLLEGVMKVLEDHGAVVDERKPDVIRLAPAPLYNTFIEVWNFVKIFTTACSEAQKGQEGPVDAFQKPQVLRGQDQHAWAEIQ